MLQPASETDQPLSSLTRVDGSLETTSNNYHGYIRLTFWTTDAVAVSIV